MLEVAWVVAGVAAVVDWICVGLDNQRIRWVSKPAVMVALTVVVLVGGDALPAGVHAWLVVAFVLSLAGDVFLLMPDRWFAAGLGSFLLGHLAFVVAFVLWRVTSPWVLVAVVGLAVLHARAGLRILRSAPGELRGPVFCYLVVISVMALAAFATGEPWLMAGAALFVASDSMLGWDRFVAPRRAFGLAVIVTYHLAQGSFAVWAVTR